MTAGDVDSVQDHALVIAGRSAALSSGREFRLGQKGYDGGMTERTYEIVFAGEAVPAIVEAFEGYDTAIGRGRTVIRAERIDQAALHGAIARLQSLGLELLEVRPVGPS